MRADSSSKMHRGWKKLTFFFFLNINREALSTLNPVPRENIFREWRGNLDFLRWTTTRRACCQQTYFKRIVKGSSPKTKKTVKEGTLEYWKEEKIQWTEMWVNIIGCPFPLEFSKLCLRVEVALPLWSSGEESACQIREQEFNPASGKIPHAAGQLSPCATTAEPTL